MGVLRLRAVAQVTRGNSGEVARVVRTHRSAVFRCLAAFRSGGSDALAAKPVTGRPQRLTPAQLGRLCDLVAGHNPDQLEFEFAPWLRGLVRG